MLKSILNFERNYGPRYFLIDQGVLDLTMIYILWLNKEDINLKDNNTIIRKITTVTSLLTFIIMISIELMENA
jgi:hypothetical protein